MKFPKIAIKIMEKGFLKMISDGRKNFYVDPSIKCQRDISYAHDNHELHKIDVYYASKRRRNICIIDIHGGAYLFGHRSQNYNIARVFLNEGFDFVTVDYIPNKDGRGTRDMVNDCIEAVDYIARHKKELQLDNDKFVMYGDSAGGHMALLITELLNDENYKITLTNRHLRLDVKAVMLNSPVYNYLELGRKQLTKGAQKYMLGPNYDDVDERRQICPKSHIKSLNVPLFLSTCKNDFIREESLLLHQDLKNMGFKHSFIDIDSYKKEVGHVHNVIDTNLSESKIVNHAMIEFISKYVQRG